MIDNVMNKEGNKMNLYIVRHGQTRLNAHNPKVAGSSPAPATILK